MWIPASGLLLESLILPTPVIAQASALTSSYAPQHTLPASVNEAPPVLLNIQDSQVVDAQTICPGYIATNVRNTTNGFTATLHFAGSPCNLYGTDIEALNLKVEYQATDRLHVEIASAFIQANNISQYILSSSLVPKPLSDSGVLPDLDFSWTNNPSFGFTVSRKSTGDQIFSTRGTKLVYENQFIEFVSALPENYNLYGLGESIHQFRLGNNFTKKFYVADVGNVVDANLYGTHPSYLETRYYTTGVNGSRTLVTSNETTAGSNYPSLSHGVYLRNAHGQDVLL